MSRERWGKMVARARDRAKISDVQLGHPQIAFPPCDIHGIKRIIDARLFLIALDTHFPFTPALRIIRRGRGFRRDDDPRVEQGMPAERSSVWKLHRIRCFNDQKQTWLLLLIHMDAIGGAFRNDQIVAWFIAQQAVIGFPGSLPAVDEHDLIPVGIAHEMLHGGPASRNRHAGIRAL